MSKKEAPSHHSSHYLAGKLLLAMPSMGDPRFERAVIFLCAHDRGGAMGLVLNQEMPDIRFEHLLHELGLESDIKVDLSRVRVPVMRGGPVEGSRGFLLHSSDFSQKDTIRIDESLSITGTVDALKDIAAGDGPEKLLFILGYAGWSPGQLEEELKQNAWLVTEPDPAIIFNKDIQKKWGQAARKLGIDPAMLTGEAGRA